MVTKCEVHSVPLKTSKFHTKYCPRCMFRESDSQQCNDRAYKVRG